MSSRVDRIAEDENSWVSKSDWPTLPLWSPNIGHLEAVPALRLLARGNAGARPENEHLPKKVGIVTVS
jgi:hypothetical protein